MNPTFDFMFILYIIIKVMSICFFINFFVKYFRSQNDRAGNTSYNALMKIDKIPRCEARSFAAGSVFAGNPSSGNLRFYPRRSVANGNLWKNLLYSMAVL